MLPEPFFDRAVESRQLEQVWQLPGAQLMTVWGRRRVGKSTLLAHFATGKRAVYLYGTRIAERDLLAALASHVADVVGDDYLRTAPFPHWEAALTYLAQQAARERLLVIFDEFPYLCEVTPGLDTLMQHWWDRIHHSGNLMVVLAGSAFSFMQGLTGYGGALHGRRTAQLAVHPFDYSDAAFFYHGYAAPERIHAYACYGGIPAYLHFIHPHAPLSENLLRTTLAPGHMLFREGEELLRTEFHQEALYSSILRAIATGEERPSDIARAVGRHSANEIFDHLQRLMELRFLRREVPVTEMEQARNQRVLYRLADPYLRFWFRFVSPFQSLLQLGQGDVVWEREVQPALQEFVARTTWEEVCAQHLWRRIAAKALSAPVAQLGRWWDSRHEIDLVGMWGGRVTLVGECKWTASPVDEAVLLSLQLKAQKLPLDTAPLWVLASRSGFTPALQRRAQMDNVLLLGPDDLFALGG